ncbi:MAG TPA: DUF3606 domain-containing protein [Phenylobacterium sp.]
MRPEERPSFDPPPLIDLKDQRQVAYWTARLDATGEELQEAIREVGPNRKAVAIWLGRADAI